MKKIKFNFFACLVIFSFLQAKITKTTLEDYAYDFSNIGYEISFSASSSYFIPMTADDYFNATDGGYTLKVYIDGLSRKSRKDFVPYYNKECELSFDGTECQLFIEGEIELILLSGAHSAAKDCIKPIIADLDVEIEAW